MTSPLAASRRKFIRKTALIVGAFTIVPRFVLGKYLTTPPTNCPESDFHCSFISN